MSYSWTPATRVTLHMKGQARAWARLPRLSSMTFLLYARSAEARRNNRNGHARRENMALLWRSPMMHHCMHSCPLWHGRVIGVYPWLLRILVSTDYILNLMSDWRRAFCIGSNSLHHSSSHVETRLYSWFPLTAGNVAEIMMRYTLKNKGGFRSNAVGEPVLVIQRTFPGSVLKITNFCLVWRTF